MSRLNELIQELCPNGIEYKTLGDIATISRGGSFQKKDFTEYGIPCIHYGQIYTRYGLSADKTITYIDATAGERAKYAEPNDIVMAVTSENVNDVSGTGVREAWDKDCPCKAGCVPVQGQNRKIPPEGGPVHSGDTCGTCAFRRRTEPQVEGISGAGIPEGGTCRDQGVL